MSFRYMNTRNWSEIKRGYVFEAATFYPTDGKRPLSFFIRDEEDPSRGTVVTGKGDFSPRLIDGKKTAKEQEVIVHCKPRKVVVLSHNHFNQSEHYEYVLIAPIMSVSSEDRKKAWYPKTKEDNHTVFVMYPNPKGGMERYVDVSQLTYIHKGMLLQKHEEVPRDRMGLIENNLLDCLDLGIVEEAPELVANEASNI